MCGHLKQLQNIYLKSIEAVKPKHLLSAENKYYLKPRLEDGKVVLQLHFKKVDITNKKCYVVGFGKAVLGMAVQLESSLGNYLHKGILSIPKGTRQQFEGVKEMTLRSDTTIEIYEGAENNQPDENALQAAKEIKRMAESMTQEDVLFVLISGGGSALLPLPKPPLQLEEKMLLIKNLSNCGATIQEMNKVRIALSVIKGGQLALAAAQAYAVISFVISDIVGNPIDLIASGPTYYSQTKNLKARYILQKYNLWPKVENHIKSIFQEESVVGAQQLENNSIYVVGDNAVASIAAEREALASNYIPFIASTTIQASVSVLTVMYCDFLNSIYDFKEGVIQEQELCNRFPFESHKFKDFFNTILECERSKKPLLLIMAGEPTVKVTGSGCGGRNQELALRLSKEFYLQPRLKNVCFLSAGTDGIDGPCLAAGAFGNSQIVTDFLRQNSSTLGNIDEFIANNDSYNFYRNLNQGGYHIITGHTGTNVMDLQFLLVP